MAQHKSLVIAPLREQLELELRREALPSHDHNARTERYIVTGLVRCQTRPAAPS